MNLVAFRLAYCYTLYNFQSFDRLEETLEAQERVALLAQRFGSS